LTFLVLPITLLVQVTGKYCLNLPGSNGIEIQITIQCLRREKFLSGRPDLPKARAGQPLPLKAIKRLRDPCPLSLSSSLTQEAFFLPLREEPEAS
jgi:hypothetical protein